MIMNEKEWRSFIEAVKKLSVKHATRAAKWDKKDTILSLILVTLTAVTTVTVALKEVPYPYPCIFSTLNMLVAIFARRINANGKRQQQLDMSKAFMSLEMRMIRSHPWITFQCFPSCFFFVTVP